MNWVLFPVGNGMPKGSDLKFRMLSSSFLTLQSERMYRYVPLSYTLQFDFFLVDTEMKEYSFCMIT